VGSRDISNERDDIVNQFSNLVQRWNDRLSPKASPVLEKYIEGRLQIALEFIISSHTPYYLYLTARPNLDSAVFHREYSSSGFLPSQTRNDNTGGAHYWNDEEMFIVDVNIVQCAKGVIPSLSVGPYGVNNRHHHNVADSLYKSAINGVYKFLPRLPKGEFRVLGGRFPIISDDIRNQNIQRRSEIVNGVANDQRDFTRIVFDDFSDKNLSAGLLIFLDSESAKITLDVGFKNLHQLTDVLLGPFDL